jgi:aminodeoxyfutalosine deaminase
MILRAHVVVTMDSPPIENGAVAINGKRIVDLGAFNEVRPRRADEVIDLGERALMPGLINAHCHLDYTHLRGKIPAPKSFTDWIRAINAEKAKLSPEDYVAAINEGFAETKKFGTTTIANLTAFPELIGQIQSPVRTWWFAELIDVREPHRTNEIVDLAIESLKSKEHWGLAPHAPFTASSDLYRRCEEVAQRENVLLTTHLAESREEFSMFRNGEGPLYDFLKSIGRDTNDCGRRSPVANFLEIVRDSSTSLGMTDRWIVAHLNEIADTDFDLLATLREDASRGSTGKFHVAHCPRSHKYFGHSQFQFEKLRELGFNICLGTDSLASTADLSLFAEMREFRRNFPSVSAEEVLRLVTLNPALALGEPNRLGCIRRGLCADLIALPIRSTAEIFDEILAFDGPIPWSMIGGDTRNTV